MPNAPISAQLSDTNREVIMSAIATIKASMPFLVDLTVEDRKALPKMGDKSRAFVTKALEIATQNPDFLPRSFDLEEMRKDVELFDQLYPLLLSLNQLQEMMENTYTAVGSEAYTAALTIYKYAKASDQGGGLEGILDDLGQRFTQKSKKEKPQPAIG
jgi:hypothetical protein